MFSTDVESIVRRNTIVYHCLTPDPAQALLFGNGAMGGSVHTPDDSLYLLIGRCDNWNGDNKMGALAAVRIRGPAGWLTRAKSIRQECNLHEAHIRIQADDTTITITCLRGRDVIVVDIEGPHACTATIENWHTGDETSATETMHVNRTSVFEAMNRKVGLEPAAVPVADPLLGRAWGVFVDVGSQARSKAECRSVDGDTGSAHATPLRPVAHYKQRILISTACSMTGADAVRQTGRTLLAEACRQADAWLAAHRQWWTQFWSRSYVSLTSATGDAEYEERLWYVTLYLIACGSGGGLPLRFNGGPYLLDQDARSWDGEYVWQNAREIYWPLFAAGHTEFLPEFFQHYRDTVPFVREQTKRMFGVDGLCFREAFSVWGCDVSPDHGHTKYNFTGNLELCLLMEWYVLATGDPAFLRDQLYPLLKEVLAFFLGYMRKGDDGRYHLAPGNAIETWWQVVDNMPDLCGLHHFLPRAIAWGRQFGEPAATLARWEEFFQHLAPIPVGRWTIERRFQDGIHAEEFLVKAELDPAGIFLPAAGQTQARTARCNMENAELYAIFPWGRVGVDSPAEEQRRAENTWNHRTWKYLNNGWAQDVLQLARLGWAERAREAQLEHASRQQRFPNGGFICAAAPHFHGLLTNTPYFDAAGVHLAGLNEMLLQSYDGILRLCPATSAEWSGRFKLHAFGGFIVEAEFVHGQPVAAAITATRDAVLRLRGEADRPMKKGETYRWGKLSAVAAVADRGGVVYPGCKLHPPRVATRTGHWHDESTGHGQVGLATDGLFPATRRTTGSIASP